MEARSGVHSVHMATLHGISIQERPYMLNSADPYMKVQTKTPNNACRADLGRYPLAIPIQKRALKFWIHLKSSPKNRLHFEAQETQELNPDKSPLCQLGLKLTNTHLAQSSTASQTPIRVHKIINQAKEDYLEHWTNQKLKPK